MKKITLNELYDIMYDHMKIGEWWPGRSDWEVLWSTVLIQNTNWKNVAKTLPILYQATKFLPQNILQLSDEKLSQVISSAGFYTRKTRTVKNLAYYFDHNFHCDLELARRQDKQKLRRELLALSGIGPETADVILMYVLAKGEFVVDTYARRLFASLGWLKMPAYEKAKSLIENNLIAFTPRSYRNFHGLIDTFNQQYKLPAQFKDSFLKDYQLIIPKEK